MREADLRVQGPGVDDAEGAVVARRIRAAPVGGVEPVRDRGRDPLRQRRAIAARTAAAASGGVHDDRGSGAQPAAHPRPIQAEVPAGDLDVRLVQRPGVLQVRDPRDAEVRRQPRRRERRLVRLQEGMNQVDPPAQPGGRLEDAAGPPARAAVGAGHRDARARARQPGAREPGRAPGPGTLRTATPRRCSPTARRRAA